VWRVGAEPPKVPGVWEGAREDEVSRPKRVPDCHPERPHYAMGLCRRCYQSTGYYVERPRRDRRFLAEELAEGKLENFIRYKLVPRELVEMAQGGCVACGVKDQPVWWLTQRNESSWMLCEGCHAAVVRMELMPWRAVEWFYLTNGKFSSSKEESEKTGKEGRI
jgi:hypothetical protein